DLSEYERQQRERENARTRRVREEAWRRRQALAIWAEAIPAINTPADLYLTWWRGVMIENVQCWRALLTDTICFHPRCPRGHERQPAMIALMRDIITNRPAAIHRTFLDDRWRREGDRMMLGPSGGAAIKLFGPPRCRSLAIAEGIEKALAALLRGFIPAGCALWVPGSADAVRLFPVLDDVGELVVLGDNDATGILAASEVMNRWRQAERRARIVL